MKQQPALSKKRLAFLQFFAEPSRSFALLLTVCAALCLLSGLLRAPRLYPIDYGQYEPYLSDCGLTYTQADLAQGALQYVRPVTEFSYAHFSWMKLLTPSAAGSTVYGAAAVRLLTAPFGLPFSVDVLSAVWAALLAWAVWSLARSGYRLLGSFVLVPGGFLCLLFTDGNFCAILRSLYPQGGAIVFTLLFAAAALRAFCTAAGTGAGCLTPLLLSGVLLLKSCSLSVLFLPLVLAVCALALRQEYKRLSHRLFAAVVCAALLFWGAGSAVALFRADSNYFSGASAYHAVFDTMLTVSPQPEADLAEFGLEKSYAADIGRSYYEEESVYAHCPRLKSEAAIFAKALTPRAIFHFYVRHPDRLAQVLRALPLPLNSYQNTRNLALCENAAGFTPTRADGGLLSWLRLLWPGSYTVWLCACLAVCVACTAAGVLRRSLLPPLGALAALCAVCYLPLAVVLCGFDGLEQTRLYQVFLQDLLLLAALCALTVWGRKASVWMAARPQTNDASACTLSAATAQTAPTCAAPASAESGGRRGNAALLDTPREAKAGPARKRRLPDMRGLLLRFLDSRLATVLAVAVLAFGMALITECKPVHAACVNNGDYGRMMGQLGLTWTSENYYDNAAQVNHGAIESYAWEEPFDWQKLTPLKPTYSLYFFVSLLRPFTEPFGLPLNTWALAVLLACVTAACVVSITWDLYPVLKRWTALAGGGLGAILCCETYLVWYNAMFGEGTILAGLVLSLTCAVHLAVMPQRGFWKRALWFSALGGSLLLLLGAKSQMLLALPAALLLVAALLWRHRPYRLDYQMLLGLGGAVLCAVLCLSAFGVYSSDREENSVTAKSNLWHTYFYGIFMISDDPIGDMEALGVDTAMAPDIGKGLSFDVNADYVYAPLSEEAETAFFNHVSMGTAVQWYLTHPAKLWYMLNHAAEAGRQLYTGYRVYVGQDYSLAHDACDGFGLWLYWRSCFAPAGFLGYVLLYGALLAAALRRCFGRAFSPQRRALWSCVLFIMLVGVLQYPLTVIGNGFADNQKQLFPFLLCHDLLALLMLVLAARWLWHANGKTLTASFRSVCTALRALAARLRRT